MSIVHNSSTTINAKITQLYTNIYTSTFSGKQFGQQLVLLFLQLVLLLLQFADGGHKSRHVCVLRLLLYI